MGIYFSNIRSILEVKRKINGQEEDLDQEDDNKDEPENNEEDNNTDDTQDENNEDDEHADPGEASDYSMDVEDDEESNDDEGSEDNQSDSEDDTEDTGDDENNEEDEHSDPGDSNDYSMDVDDSEDGEDSDNTEDSTEDSEEDDTSSGDSEGGDTELKSLEDDIFKDVPPEQMNIKIMELKKQYLEVYATITDVLTRCNKIPKTTQNMKVVEFIVNKLVEFKELVNFYLSNTFDTKTYVENMVNYQQYLATLNTINKLLKEINTKKENNS